jgi:spermidine synthase
MQIQSNIKLSVVVLGFSSIFIQVILLREFLSVFWGNELVMGIVLTNWMLLTGFGAYLGKFFPKIKYRNRLLLCLQVVFAVLPVITVLSLYYWRMVFFTYGSMPGLVPILCSSFVLQFPVCLVNGFLFTACNSLLSESSGKNYAGNIYALEALGSVIGGIILNFILLRTFGSFAILKLLMVINFVTFILVLFSVADRIVTILVSGMVTIIVILVLAEDFQGLSRKTQFRDQKVIYDRSTPYGTVVVTENAGQRNYFENGLPLFSSGNDILNEEEVHFSMSQRPHSKNILLISGGISGTLKEIKKYNPLRIDYVELNPALIETGRKYSASFDDPLIHVYNKDGRRFLNETNETYEIVIINLPAPSTIQINRYYTREFFTKIQEKLSLDGVISLSLPSTEDYVSATAANLNSSLFYTLNSVFKNVLILPGQKNYFLASDSSLTTGIAGMIALLGIQTKYVNRYYLDDELLKDRSNFILHHLAKSNGLNEDFRPLTYFNQINYWTSYFKINWLILAGIFLVLLILVFLSLNRISFGLFTGGFTASSLEILILIAFQVIYGYVFSMAGIIIMIFMAGLATGAFIWKRVYPRWSSKSYLHIQLTIGLFSMCFPFIILFLHDAVLPGWFIHSIFYLLTLFISFFIGVEYSLASVMREQPVATIAAKNYSADLFGSAMGAILTTIILFPLLGLIWTCIFLAFLNGLSTLIFYLTDK